MPFSRVGRGTSFQYVRRTKISLPRGWTRASVEKNDACAAKYSGPSPLVRCTSIVFSPATSTAGSTGNTEGAARISAGATVRSATTLPFTRTRYPTLRPSSPDTRK
jgi:hypothetical protein